MSNSVRRFFLEEPRLRSAAFRYGYLGFLLALCLLAVIVACQLSPSARGRYFGVVVPPTLLVSHLAFQFRWPASVKIGLRILALTCSGAVLGYTLAVVFT